LGSKYLLNEIDFSDFVTKVKELLLKISTNYISSNLLEDDRIIKAIKYIEQNSNRVIPAQELAKHCHLSESRFLHLFKEKTSITYRQAQLWVKLSQSIPMLFKQKITDTAYEFGFSDSAHYSRVFKQNFGFSPKVFSKL
jgi:AraC-like DNA-binding protein